MVAQFDVSSGVFLSTVYVLTLFNLFFFFAKLIHSMLPFFVSKTPGWDYPSTNKLQFWKLLETRLTLLAKPVWLINPEELAKTEHEVKHGG